MYTYIHIYVHIYIYIYTYIFHDIYLLPLGFHPVAVGGRCIRIGKRQPYTKGETIHKTIQKHRIHKIENKHIKPEKNIKRILKNMSRVIGK